MVAILNYNVGNIASINNMLNRIGIDSIITDDVEIINKATHLILPGVGSFDYCMSQIHKASFFNQLNKWIFDDKKIILGVCVGHQMLFEKSEEGDLPGLGWIKGKVVKFDSKISFRVPHMGWNYLSEFDKNSLLFKGFENPKFYFVHSYYTIPESDEVSLAKTEYGVNFTCSVGYENIFGVQFHPEKSHKYGMKLYENFAKI
ncbi:MAG: imidazole glycerol phosphate synthase subunit HisH [Saprospiraceae bacterium]|nr:imidazole glycerol phosphate synthase subunit HisH [Saprospiraceae bacterium]